MSLKVVLVDDHTIFREGLRCLIEKQPDLEVVGEAADGRKAIHVADELRPDLVIMDVKMPVMNGIDATRQIVDKFSGVKVLALSMYSDTRFVLEMLRAGASGYLLKDSTFEELNRAIRTVVSNKIYLSPGIACIVVETLLSQQSSSDSLVFSLLTDREREVLQLLSEGNSTKQIALHLYVSVKTVESHRKNIMNKLDIHTVAELTKYAIREGLTSL
ncbi:MAG TPA: response regulator transcription factor [Nitrospirae bacterium]|nr:oxygen regulatory protein NreC [bacterium BMS3Abin08]HDY72393.1 response regulator transcription factor [Nitrospirota bacterium]